MVYLIGYSMEKLSLDVSTQAFQEQSELLDGSNSLQTEQDSI